jgi:hypothetical protein
MYAPINEKSGVEVAHTWLEKFAVQASADGLVVTPPQADDFYDDISIPEHLRTWLLDLRLLRHIPLAYFVPDVALLPAESIRFFHVDATWMDRVIDGAFSAANTGTLDMNFNVGLLGSVREALDADLLALAQDQVPATQWEPGKSQMTGMLIRSELVRRWPDLIVEAYEKTNKTGPIALLRAEPISRDLYLALFAGVPKLVLVKEPFKGVRFGVEPVAENSSSPPYKVDKRKPDGSDKAGSINIVLKDKRVIDVTALAAAAISGQPAPANSPANKPRMVALHLEQRPYVQEFKSTVPEPRGSIPPPANQDFVLLSKGRVMNLAPLKARAAKLAELEGI